MSEVFLFARRLARKIPDMWTISVGLSDMQDRMLDIRVPEPFGLYSEYKCDVPAISLSVEVHSEELQARYDDLAVEMALEIAGRFGWRGNGLEGTFREAQYRMYRYGEVKAMPAASAAAAASASAPGGSA